MKITHLSTYDVEGGAARAAHRLHQGLVRGGHESSMLVFHKATADPTIVALSRPMDVLSRAQRYVRGRAIAKRLLKYAHSRPLPLERFSEDRSRIGGTLVEQIRSCDVVHLHWVADFLDYESFFSAIPDRARVVWTLHDMNPVTGGCHYDMGCGRYRQGCGACPQLGSLDSRDLSARVWGRKRASLGNLGASDVCIVTPSRWLAQVVKDSPLLSRFRLETIPYGIDLHDFAPRERTAARYVLGIPQEAKVLLFVADWMNIPRKGFDVLARALAGCSNLVDDLWLLSVGHGPPPRQTDARGSHIGYIADDRFLSRIYSAADLFILPSLEDNLPNTVLEALACGTPVVGFAVGGVPDMVRHGTTGVLVPPAAADALRTAIVELLLDEPKRKEMSLNCRRVAVEEYSLELQAQRYSELYETLC